MSGWVDDTKFLSVDKCEILQLQTKMVFDVDNMKLKDCGRNLQIFVDCSEYMNFNGYSRIYKATEKFHRKMNDGSAVILICVTS